MKTAILVITLTVAACGKQAVAPTDNAVRLSQAIVPAETPAKPELPTAKPFSAEEETDLYSFKYSWPAEAAAVPQLAERFTKEMQRTKLELIAAARADREERRKQGFDFHPYDTQLSYETAGQSDRLLSLAMSVYAFTGGAHGSSGSGALLWDGKRARQISFQDLLQPGQSWTGAIRQPFCVLLDREREKRRGEPVRPDDMFGGCPKI